MQVFLIIFLQEIKLNFRHFEKIMANLLFFLIFFSIFSLISQSQQNQAFSAEIFIWFSLISVLIFSNCDFLKKDFEDGSLEQILLACENFEIAIFAKMLASWLCNASPILLAIFLIKFDLNFFLIALLASLAINFICCFCGALSLPSNNSALIAVIVLPLIIPILLISQISPNNISQNDFYFAAKLLAALAIFCAAFSSFATAKIVKIIL